LQKVQQILQEPSRASPPVMRNHLREPHAERDSRTERERKRETQRERERILALEREEREYEDRLFGPGHAKLGHAGNRPTSPALEDMLAVSAASLRARVMHAHARAHAHAHAFGARCMCIITRLDATRPSRGCTQRAFLRLQYV
jgi:hypothetical protein